MTTQLFQSGGVQTTVILPQIIYLDFDGEFTRYDGELLTIDSVTVEDSGLTAERIAAITAMLNQQFRDQNVEFVTEKPASGDYSTIFIGKTSSFAPYGSFAGLAETVDSGNTIHNDNAFVMLDSLSSNDRIADVIAHEAGHLLGTLDHGGEGLAKYAKNYYVSSGITYSDFCLNSGDSMYIFSGGMTDSTTINWRGILYVSNGGVANSTIVNGDDYWGQLYISSGGIANNVTINKGGYMEINTTGVAQNVNVKGGTLVVSSGGTANNVVWTPGIGYVYEEDGADVTYASKYFGVYLGSADVLISSAIEMSNKNITSNMYAMIKQDGRTTFFSLNPEVAYMSIKMV